jgi:AP-4 complex subunit epsilon-1
VSPKYAQEHQVAVIDCLEDPDETLKLKTLELLVTMTKANNVQVQRCWCMLVSL